VTFYRVLLKAKISFYASGVSLTKLVGDHKKM